MIKNAQGYENKLKIESVWARDLPLNGGYVFGKNDVINIYDDNEKYYQVVSVHKGELVGFFRYEIKDNWACNYEYIRFNYEKQTTKTFIKDFIAVRDNIVKTLLGAKGSVKNTNPMYRHIVSTIRVINGDIEVKDNWTYFTIDSEKCRNATE